MLGDPEVPALEFEDGEKGYGLAVGDSVPLVDQDLPRAAALGEFETKPAFPRSRLGDHPDDLRVPRDCPLQCCLKSAHLALAADELGKAARVGDLEAGPNPTHALELVDPNRVMHPLDLE